MNKMGFVYIMTNKNKTTLYIGVTNDLCRRIYEHKNHLIKNSFTDRYILEYCIYFEEFAYFDFAIHREKELKKWSRQKKEDLINKKNPDWKVLVTEHGFVRDSSPSARNDVQQILPSGRNDGSHSNEIPPSGRNDGIPDGGKVREVGGGAAHFSHPTPKTEYVIPNATQWSEESAFPPFDNPHHSERSEETQPKKGNNL